MRGREQEMGENDGGTREGENKCTSEGVNKGNERDEGKQWRERGTEGRREHEYK